MFGDLLQLPPVIRDAQVKRYYDHTFGGSYFFFLSLSSLLSPPEPPPAE
jgi:hypothetical protein